jgi:hypothetical protein
MPAGYRKVYQYDLEGNWIKEHENISAASFSVNEKDQSLYFCVIGRYNFSRGYFWTYEYYTKLPDTILSKIRKSKYYKSIIYNKSKIYQYDIGGNLLREYNSLSEVSDDEIYKKNIRRILEGRYKKSNNFIWSLTYYKKLPKDILKNHTHKTSKNIYQYDKNGNFIKKYESISVVSNIFNVRAGSISNALNGIRCKIYKNFIWRSDYYKKLPNEILKNHIDIRHKIILQYDLNGKFIKEWSSSTEISKKYKSIGNISSVCTGNRKNALGFIWKYKN